MKRQFRKGFCQRGKDGILYFVRAIKLGGEKMVIKTPVKGK
jgi:hypothetical protein